MEAGKSKVIVEFIINCFFGNIFYNENKGVLDLKCRARS